MKTTIEREQRFVFLGSQKGLFKAPLPPRVSVCHDRTEVDAAVAGPTNSLTWISFTRGFTDMLLERAVATRTDLRGTHLLTIAPPRAESIPALLGLFHPVFGVVEGFQWLPKEELVEALTREDAADLFIGGIADPKAKTLTLLRGNIGAVVAPFAAFQKSGDGTQPDFDQLQFTDYGRTISLGEYEASADAILYELDADYRRRLKKLRRLNEQTFGASLMRLRKQARLKRSDFAPISAKEIARIERNEVGQPHTKTLDIVCSKLNVRLEEIGTY